MFLGPHFLAELQCGGTQSRNNWSEKIGLKQMTTNSVLTLSSASVDKSFLYHRDPHPHPPNHIVHFNKPHTTHGESLPQLIHFEKLDLVTLYTDALILVSLVEGAGLSPPWTDPGLHRGEASGNLQREGKDNQ